jgi:hypothetical protein
MIRRISLLLDSLLQLYLKLHNMIIHLQITVPSPCHMCRNYYGVSFALKPTKRASGANTVSVTRSSYSVCYSPFQGLQSSSACPMFHIQPGPLPPPPKRVSNGTKHTHSYNIRVLHTTYVIRTVWLLPRFLIVSRTKRSSAFDVNRSRIILYLKKKNSTL